jgi:recombinational DNA repair protein RecR
MDYPQPVQNLIAQVSRLPGIGKRSLHSQTKTPSAFQTCRFEPAKLQ